MNGFDFNNTKHPDNGTSKFSELLGKEHLEPNFTPTHSLPNQFYASIGSGYNPTHPNYSSYQSNPNYSSYQPHPNYSSYQPYHNYSIHQPNPNYSNYPLCPPCPSYPSYPSYQPCPPYTPCPSCSTPKPTCNYEIPKQEYNPMTKHPEFSSTKLEEQNYVQKKYLDTYLRGYDAGFDSGYENGYNTGYFKGLASKNSCETPISTPMPTQKPNVEHDDNSEKSKNNYQDDDVSVHTPPQKPHDLKTKTTNTTSTTDLKTIESKIKKPLLIIRKINKEDRDTGTFGSMLNNLFGTNLEDEKSNVVNYLEDSDDEIDNLVTVSDVKCNDEYKINKKKEYSDIKILSIKDIIQKDNVESIDDLIVIGNYYENLINKENIKRENTEENVNFEDNMNEITYSVKDGMIKNETSGKISGESDEEYKMIERIMESLDIDIKSTEKIVINKNKPNDLITREEKNLNKVKTFKFDKDTERKFSLYELNNIYYTINLEKVFKMRGILVKLKKMIGLDNIKNEIIDMILYYLMEFERENNNMLHMTLEGSPGCGKTKLAKIISKLLGAMGVVSNNKVVYARRTDMIGQYLGQTTAKTQQVINSALGGVLFIDEAYSLGNSKKDIYSKECLDILNQNLSDNKKKLVCIIAGYPEELENYFFSSNPGLTRRFPFRFKIKNYSHQELLNIFVNKINKLEWKFEQNVKLEKFFESNISDFKFFGGDIDTFIQDIKYSHSRRVVCSHPEEFKIITKKDMDIAFEKFKARRKNTDTDNWKSMFV